MGSPQLYAVAPQSRNKRRALDPAPGVRVAIAWSATVSNESPQLYAVAPQSRNKRRALDPAPGVRVAIAWSATVFDARPTVPGTLRGRLSRIAMGVFAGVLVTGCGGGGGSGGSLAPPNDNGNSPPPGTTSTVVSTSAYVPGAPYADVLRRCTYAGDATQQCTLHTLPFLGMEFPDPTVDDILERTLVSDRWMGDNLKTALEELPPDVLPLFRSVTAVVIASDVRPAHYDSRTGAIYLDADYLWLSAAERATVSTAPDPRSSFGLDLMFDMPWRYVSDNQRLTVYVNPDGSRDPDQIELIMGYLLYHELAHAADFVPPSRFGILQPNQTVRQVLAQYPPLSDDFENALPLNSGQLKALAAVSFLGDSSTAEQRNVQPDDLVTPFVDDGAVQYYSYTTQYEDFAVLFETAMMKWHFGYEKDTAITDRPASGNTDEAVVAWETRGRLGEKPVYDRVRAVGELIYPGDITQFEAFIDAQPPPQRMTVGNTWGENLILGVTSASQAASAPHAERRRADHFLERVPIL